MPLGVHTIFALACGFRFFDDPMATCCVTRLTENAEVAVRPAHKRYSPVMTDGLHASDPPMPPGDPPDYPDPGDPVPVDDPPQPIPVPPDIPPEPLRA
jgi:hypothetical protein